MFRSVHTVSRLCNHSNASVSRFLLLSCNTVPKTATLGSVSSSGASDNKFHLENIAPSVFTSTVSNEPRPFQPWQIKNHCSAYGFAISGRKVLMNAHVVPNHTALKVRNHGSLTNPNEVKTKSEPKKVKTKKTKARVKTKSKVKTNVESRRTMFNKQHRGKLKGTSSSEGNHICFGKYALQTLESAYITSRQIEAGRRVMAPNVRRGGKIWVRIFPDRSVTAKPTEMRMGRGKGAVSHCVAVVKRGKIIYEMTGVSESIARKAIATAATKMPIRTQFVVSE